MSFIGRGHVEKHAGVLLTQLERVVALLSQNISAAARVCIQATDYQSHTTRGAPMSGRYAPNDEVIVFAACIR